MGRARSLDRRSGVPPRSDSRRPARRSRCRRRSAAAATRTTSARCRRRRANSTGNRRRRSRTACATRPSTSACPTALTARSGTSAARPCCTEPRSPTGVRAPDTLLLTNDHVAAWPAVTDGQHTVEGVPSGCKKITETLALVDDEHDSYGRDDIPVTRVVTDPQLDVAVLKTSASFTSCPGRSATTRACASATSSRSAGFRWALFAPPTRARSSRRTTTTTSATGTTTTSSSTPCSRTAIRGRRSWPSPARPASTSWSASITPGTARAAR